MPSTCSTGVSDMHRRRFIEAALLATTGTISARAVEAARRPLDWPVSRQPLDRLVKAGIWDSFYYGSWQERAAAIPLTQALSAERAAILHAGIGRQCVHLHVGAGT